MPNRPLQIRLKDAERIAWEASASAQNQSLADWIRDAAEAYLVALAKPEKPVDPQLPKPETQPPEQKAPRAIHGLPVPRSIVPEKPIGALISGRIREDRDRMDDTLDLDAAVSCRHYKPDHDNPECQARAVLVREARRKRLGLPSAVPDTLEAEL